MKLDTLYQAEAKTANQLAHVGALLDALGNPSEWSYTGTVIDTGANSQAKCACGHEIRYAFIIAHPCKGQSQVGSACIDHIALITPGLGDQLVAARQALEADIAAAKKAAAKAQADAVNQALWADYCAKRDSIRAMHKANRDNRVRSPREAWYFCEGWHEKFNRTNQPEYSRAADLRKWLEKAITRVESVLKGGAL